jgi:CRP-like cAMP-binding protein
VFADLPEDQLKWFADNVEDLRSAQGDVVFRKGDPPDWLVIYLEGEIHAYWDENVHDEVYIVRAGDPATEVTGMLPFLA